MSTRATTTTPRRAPIPTSASATRATVPPDPSGLWIVPGCGRRRHTLHRHFFFCILDQDVTSRISKTRCDTDGRKLTEHSEIPSFSHMNK